MNHRRKQCREGEPCRPESDAQAWHCLIEHSAIPVKDLVGRLASDYDIHVSAGYLYESANPYRQVERGGYVQARLLVPLTEVTGNYVVLDWIERRLGRVAIPLPAETPATRELFQAGTEAIQQFSESLQAYTSAVADGTVSAEELELLTREAHESMAATLRLVEVAKARFAAQARPLPRFGTR